MQQYFEHKTRENGESIIIQKEDSPRELSNLIITIHSYFDESPNDWIYRVIYEAFSDLENDSLDDLSIEGDIYNKDLIEWLYNSFAPEYCNEVLEEGNFKDFFEIIRGAQYHVKSTIYQMVDEFLTEYKRQGE